LRPKSRFLERQEEMRVLGVSSSYIPLRNTGGQRTLHELLKALARRGHDVAVTLTTSHEDDTDYQLDGIRIRSCQSFLELQMFACAADVVVAHLAAVPIAVEVARIHKRPLVQLVHGDDRKSRQRVKLGAELVVFCAEWMTEKFSHLASPCTVVHPPIDPSVYATNPGEKVTLVNLSHLKGVDIFYKLVDKLPDLDFLGVVGGHEKQIIKNFPNLEIVENTSNMKEAVYSQTKVVLMPSRYESYGRIAIEAAVSGIPTIATPTPGLREAIGSSGMFVELDRVENWVTALRRIMTPEVYSVYSRASLNHAEMVDMRTQQELEVWVNLVAEIAKIGRKVWK